MKNERGEAEIMEEEREALPPKYNISFFSINDDMRSRNMQNLGIYE